jgi:hypothetical protein
MRINELNMFQNMLGRAKEFGGRAPNTAGVGSAKSAAKKSGLSPEDQLTQDIFVKKFVTRGLNSIKTAVEQGIVDVNAGRSPAQPASAPAPAQPAPAQPAAGGTAPAASTAPAGTAPNASIKKGQSPGDQAIATGQKQGVAKPAIDQQVDKLVSAMRKLQPAGTKPLPATMKKKKDPATGKMVNVRIPTSKLEKEIVADLDKVSTNKDYLLRVADRIQKANAQGYDVKNVHTQFMGQLAKGMKNKSIQEARMFELLVKLITEEKFRQQVRESGLHPSVVITKFKTLLENSTNEGIVDKVKGFFGGGKPAAAPAAPAAGGQPAAAAPAAQQQGSGGQSLGQWFNDTFMKNFLKGIDLTAAMPQIQKILDNMGASYKAGTIAKDLQNIAMIAFAQSDMGKGLDKDSQTA